ncbi:MAG: hypothetical protein LBG83_04840 [Oscillospiraceae bacterium]|jgi:hypothetical protein|nr:hypothetical protein [Oscillospiraceae bacterium]
MGKLIFKKMMSKWLALGFAGIYVLAATMFSTYAWVTNQNVKINKTKGNLRLDSRILEVFVAPEHWLPGETKQKEVKAWNKGNTAVLARITFEEEAQTFGSSAPDAQPAPQGTAPELFQLGQWAAWQTADQVFEKVNLPGGAPQELVVKAQALQDGQYQYAVYLDLGSGNYQRADAVFSVAPGAAPLGGDILNVTEIRYWSLSYNAATQAAWGKAVATTATVTPPAAADAAALLTDTRKKITIDYSNRVAALSASPSADAGKWFYNENDGYFYYLGKIAPGTSSNSLMSGLTLDESGVANYSGSKLKLTVHMETVQASPFALRDIWGLTPSSNLCLALEYYCL